MKSYNTEEFKELPFHFSIKKAVLNQKIIYSEKIRKLLIEGLDSIIRGNLIPGFNLIQESLKLEKGMLIEHCNEFLTFNINFFRYYL